MTRDELLALVASELEDEGRVYFTTSDLINSFHDGVELVAVLTGCVEKVANFVTVPNQPYYNLAQLVPDYFRPIAIWNSRTRQWLTPVSYNSFEEVSEQWEILTGSVTQFAMVGSTTIVLHRTPVDVTEMILLYEAAGTQIIHGNEEPPWDSSYHDILKLYIEQDLLDINLEFTKSTNLMRLLQERLNSFRHMLFSRTMPDRVFTLQCQYLQQTTLTRLLHVQR